MCGINFTQNIIRKSSCFIVGILIFFTHWAEAKKIYQPNVRDRLSITDTVCMMEIPFISVGASGDSCVWDFTRLRDSIPRDFFIATTPKDTGQFAITKVYTRYHYRMENDSVWQTGYENNRMEMRFTTPALLFTLPLTYQDTFQCRIDGKGEYCHLLPISVKGKSVTCVDGRGMLLLPDATIDSVVRVHTTQTLCESVGDTLLSTIQYYQWFCPQISYPLLETIEVQKKVGNDTTIYAAAFYYQFADTLKQHVDSIVLPEEKDSISSIFTEAQFMPNPVLNDLQISYKLTQTANIHFSLHNNLGVVMYISRAELQEEGEHSKTISMGGYPQGTYVLYIHIDNVILSETIIKQ